jgi:hypothetical protein
LEHVVERSASVAERVGPVGDDDRRLELHTRSIPRPGLIAASLPNGGGEPLTETSPEEAGRTCTPERIVDRLA